MYGVVEPQCLSPLQHVSVLGRYAGALSAVPVEQKQAGDVVLQGVGQMGQRLKQEGPSLDDSWVQELMKSAISGFGQLPADQRVEASCCLEWDGTLRFFFFFLFVNVWHVWLYPASFGYNFK